jgi:hypothetical protein
LVESAVNEHTTLAADNKTFYSSTKRMEDNKENKKENTRTPSNEFPKGIITTRT